MSKADLHSDCSRCAALCCVALPFDRSDAFAYDKKGGEPCRHLDEDFRCTIHGRLAQKGFSGCVRFECYGAGQRVVQEVFSGRNWRDEPEIAAAMFDAFRVMRKVHELLAMLEAATRLDIGGDQKRALEGWQAVLDPEEGWTPTSLARFEKEGRAREIEAFLSDLKHHPGVVKTAQRLSQSRSGC